MILRKILVRPETLKKFRQLKDLSKTQNYRELNQIVEQLTNEEMTVDLTLFCHFTTLD